MSFMLQLCCHLNVVMSAGGWSTITGQTGYFLANILDIGDIPPSDPVSFSHSCEAGRSLVGLALHDAGQPFIAGVHFACEAEGGCRHSYITGLPNNKCR